VSNFFIFASLRSETLQISWDYPFIIYIIINYNLSSTEQFNQFCEILTNINFELQQHNSDMYLMGDFNLDVLKYQSCNLSKTYIDLLFLLGLLQVITKPTRCKPNSASLIDH
jgi:hypothetical protein